MSPCQPGNEWCFCLFFVFAGYSFILFWMCRPFFFVSYILTVHGSTGTSRIRLQHFRVYVQKKRREPSRLCVENMWNSRSCLQLRVLSFSTGSTLGDKYDLVMALCSQIFEYLRETFCRRALEWSRPALKTLMLCQLPALKTAFFSKSKVPRRYTIIIGG